MQMAPKMNHVYKNTNKAELYILTHTRKRGLPPNEEAAVLDICFLSSFSLIWLLTNKQDS